MRHTATPAPVRWEVVIRRRNGRLLKAIPARSRYAARVAARDAAAKYDHTFSITVESTTG